MENYQLIEVNEIDATRTHIIIDNGDGSVTSMLKSIYDTQQANQNNPVGGN
jgi:hypothetical protein